MDKIKSQRIPILISLVVLILLSAAVPFPNSAALTSGNEKSDLVALKIQNDFSSYCVCLVRRSCILLLPGSSQEKRKPIQCSVENITRKSVIVVPGNFKY